MPVDVRATVTCSLGTLISGNLSDSYIQGNGLVQTQGAVEIAGTITPAVGTAVTFAYKYNGGTRNLPRKLRVLSSFADPLRRTTRVQLGCKLTYLSDLRQRLKWSALDDPANAGLNAADAEIITIPIHASSVFTKCLTELGLTASSNPLTNRFSVAEYDYSAGYVAVMAELLTSENYFGYLDFNEVLQVVNLNQNGGTAVVVGTGQIIDLSDINAGALPGEAVTVNYSSLQLKAAPAVDDWSTSRSSNRSSVTISYSDPLDGSRQGIVFSVLETEEETSEFQPLTKASTQERINVLSYRKVVRTESSPKVLGSVMVQFLEAGISPPVAQLVTTTEEWFYYDAEGNEIRTVKETYADRAYGFGQVSLPMVFDVTSGGVTTKQAVSLPIGQTYLQDATETDTTVQGTLRKVVTRRYGNWLATIAGQQSVAESRNSFTTKAEVEDYLDTALSGRWFLGADIRTEDNTSSSQRVPFKPEIINQQYSTNGNPANGYRTESSSQVVLALGSATAQRRTEFSLPKAPDDYFYKSGGGYGSIRSDAKAKAKAYGSVQNRLLLGNRSGMNLRLAAWQMPEAPFAPLVVQANGLSALYRTNAISYTISAEGIVAATDALFWGAVGGTGSFWFPVAPGVTTLPSTPATSTLAITGTNDASQTVTIATLTTMAVSSLVLPYNETAVLAPTTRTTLVATSLPYALTASTAQAITTKTKMTGRRVRLIDVPATAVTVASATPQVSISALVSAPLVAVTVAAAAPAVASGASVAVPVVDVTIAGVVPDLVGRLKTQVIIPAAEVAVIVGLPAVSTGSLIAVPSAAISVAAQAPVIYDSDALEYIAAVEAADGQALEVAIYEAIDNFVRGCKSDGIWSAIKSCCILAGARTLNGALTPLKGTAPTNTGFVSGDYNRETGLIGNGSSKYLDANRANNAETQNNQHLAAYMSSGQSSGLGGIIGNAKTNGSYIYDEVSTWFASRGGSEFSSAGSDTSFVGLSRSVSGSFVSRKAGTSTTRTQTSSSPDAGNIYVFALNGNSGAYLFSSSRLAFYSIGEALTLSTLDSRVATLITAIGNAI